MKKYLFSILLIALLSLPLSSFAGPIRLNLTYPTIMGKTITGATTPNELVAWLYYFIITIAGLAAFIMLVWAGVEWLTSAGSTAAISSAKERALGAFLGLIIIFASYIIIQIINPELLILNLKPLE